ncbi:hypothetical protein [Candidatus Seribacter sulfatis]|uniref:hypothetical protein n=1 Tax=Candidatus Seribacter sulfatis TaxID=3381756 RepID=UPI00389B2ABC
MIFVDAYKKKSHLPVIPPHAVTKLYPFFKHSVFRVRSWNCPAFGKPRVVKFASLTVGRQGG